jgi:hypothetical protein
MPLESATHINGLDAANPTGSDAISSGDDHIRLLKATIKATFPNFTGALTASQTALDTAVTRATTANDHKVPTGGIIMWSGTVASIPTGWLLCDGTNSTPDLRDRFIVGARQDDAGTAKTNITGALTTTGGSKDAIAVAHSHGAGTLATASGGFHDHSYTAPQFVTNMTAGGTSGWTSAGAATTSPAGAHTHTISGSTDSAGSSGTNANLPPYYALAFIMKS